LQQWRSTPISNSRANNNSLNKQEIDKANWGWSWLERWMAAKPWESRLMEQSRHHADATEKTPPPKKCVDLINSKKKFRTMQCQS